MIDDQTAQKFLYLSKIQSHPHKSRNEILEMKPTVPIQCNSMGHHVPQQRGLVHFSFT